MHYRWLCVKIVVVQPIDYVRLLPMLPISMHLMVLLLLMFELALSVHSFVLPSSVVAAAVADGGDGVDDIVPIRQYHDLIS